MSAFRFMRLTSSGSTPFARRSFGDDVEVYG